VSPRMGDNPANRAGMVVLVCVLYSELSLGHTILRILAAHLGFDICHPAVQCDKRAGEVGMATEPMFATG